MYNGMNLKYQFYREIKELQCLMYDPAFFFIVVTLFLSSKYSRVWIEIPKFVNNLELEMNNEPANCKISRSQRQFIPSTW